MALVDISRDGAVVTVTLTRPEARNALSVEMCEDITVALHGVDADPDARVVQLRGSGSVFCAGADLQAVSGPEAQGFLPAFEAMLETLARFRLPTIAVIQGAALGGGLQLASVCDFRIATRSAKLGIPSSRLGILVNFENVQRLVLLVGTARAKEILMTGATYTAPEAVGLGLLTSEVPDDQLDATAEALSASLATGAPLSVQGSKRAIQAVVDHLSGTRAASPEVVAEIDRLVGEAYASEDLAEGVRALQEKRTPEFRGG
ncbi:MAG: enoyl-CoA hydratase-related protein [Actinomycetota bacterium]|nr:enoyl-CoA hydratase-related protein [Actinomycetota bacterium]